MSHQIAAVILITHNIGFNRPSAYELRTVDLRDIRVDTGTSTLRIIACVTGYESNRTKE